MDLRSPHEHLNQAFHSGGRTRPHLRGELRSPDHTAPTFPREAQRPLKVFCPLCPRLQNQSASTKSHADQSCKSIHFQNCIQGNKLRKTVPNQSRNHQISNFCETNHLATRPTTNAFCGFPRGPNLDSKIAQKSDLEASTQQNVNFSHRFHNTS